MAKTVSSAPPWLFTVIFFAIGLGLFGGGIYSFLSTRAFLGNAVSANGAVFDLKAHWDSDDSSYTYYPRVRFRTENGEVHEFTGDVGSNPAAFDVGENVRVLFDPANPSVARIDSFMQLWFTSLILVGMGLVFSVFGGSGIFVLARGERRETAPSSRSAPETDPPAAEPVRGKPRHIMAMKRVPGVVDRDRRD
jgi:hypothetical protein